MYIVQCRECGEDHGTENVQFVNVEEDIQGRDVFTFVCPKTGLTTASLVYGSVDIDLDEYNETFPDK
jgi:hypothetical protein